MIQIGGPPKAPTAEFIVVPHVTIPISDPPYVVAGLDHFGRHVVIVDARGRRVDAGEAAVKEVGVAGPEIAQIGRARAFAAISSIVAFEKGIESDEKSNDEHRTRAGGERTGKLSV